MTNKSRVSFGIWLTRCTIAHNPPPSCTPRAHGEQTYYLIRKLNYIKLEKGNFGNGPDGHISQPSSCERFSCVLEKTSQVNIKYTSIDGRQDAPLFTIPLLSCLLRDFATASTDLKYTQWSLIMRCWFNNHVEMLKEGTKIRKKLSEED